MPIAILILIATLMPLVMAAGYLLARCWSRWQFAQEELSEVSRQHLEIFQTGEFNEAAVATIKRRFHDLFDRGREGIVEASLQPGLAYIYQVRALAEIGTEAAARILERQLERRLSDDPLEQAWYWIDQAATLRLLNRQDSLPHLLRASERACESPLGHYYAAELACFLGFAGYLRDADGPMAQAALKVLLRVVEGLRFGVSPLLIVEARLGEILETLWDHRPAGAAPLHVSIVHEVLRLIRRAPHLKAVLSEEMAEHESYDWQLSRIVSLESAMREYLKEAPAKLLARVPMTKGVEQTDLLRALCDLRVDAAGELLPLARQEVCENRALMIDLLRWSRDPQAAIWMRLYASAEIAMDKRARHRPHAEAPRQPSVPVEVPYGSILRSLRGHPSIETETFLMLACQDWDPVIRCAGLSSVGWWEPMLADEVRECLAKCRRDPSPEVRQAARAALARLGERAALHWFRQALLADDPRQIAEAAHVIANEGLTLLWPELDRLLDLDNVDVVLHAREAVEQMAEDMEQSRSWSF